MEKLGSCKKLKEFMWTQLEVIRRHLDEHKWLRHIDDREKAIESFVQDYGWLIRELYCTRICDERMTCEVALHLSSSGDLLKDHLK